MRLVRFEQKHILFGGEATIMLVSSAKQVEVELIFGDIWRALFQFEKQFSRFLPMSELSIFNANAGMRFPISDDFRALLKTSLRLSKETDGLHNPFTLPALQRAGYSGSAVEGYENDEVPLFDQRSVVDYDALEISDTWASIPYGTAIDLGGCGKGYAADLVRTLLKHAPVEGYLLSLSGDIASWGVEENGQNWNIAIQDARQDESELAIYITCPRRAFGVATSGTLHRKNQQKGDWHHIIDPKTQLPARTDIRLATICADTTTQADVLATCAIILGSKDAPSFLRNNNVDSYVLQTESGLIKNGSFIVEPAKVIV